MSSTESSALLAGKYLTFAMGGESYGIPVIKVKEIINQVAITVVPQVPAYIEGVINLRGKIVPIVDMRAKFNLKETSGAERPCIIVVQLSAGSRNPLSMGLIVDAVEEVVNISPDAIEETPHFGTDLGPPFITGMAKMKGKVVCLLDIDHVLGTASIQHVTDILNSNFQ